MIFQNTMSLPQYYTIDTPTIQSYITGLDRKNPKRTKSYVDLFLQNIQKNLVKTLSKIDKFMIEVDHDKKQISLMGDKLSPQPWRYYGEDPDQQDALYENIVYSIETLKDQGLEGIAIKEIIPESRKTNK